MFAPVATMVALRFAYQLFEIACASHHASEKARKSAAATSYRGFGRELLSAGFVVFIVWAIEGFQIRSIFHGSKKKIVARQAELC
jgi:hypothetical protein